MKKILAVGVIAGALLFAPSLASAQYYVKKGDTLAKIAARHNMSLAEIISLNPQFENPNLIHIGDFVVIDSGNTAQDLIEYARSLQDVTNYVYGGQEGVKNTDCSGWVQAIYKKFGVHLPRTSREQARVGTPVTFQQLRPADLMFFSTRADKVITHVGIYMGNEYWISNLNEVKDVEILSTWGAWTQKYFLWGQRVL